MSDAPTPAIGLAFSDDDADRDDLPTGNLAQLLDAGDPDRDEPLTVGLWLVRPASPYGPKMYLGTREARNLDELVAEFGAGSYQVRALNSRGNWTGRSRTLTFGGEPKWERTFAEWRARGLTAPPDSLRDNPHAPPPGSPPPTSSSPHELVELRAGLAALTQAVQELRAGGAPRQAVDYVAMQREAVQLAQENMGRMLELFHQGREEGRRSALRESGQRVTDDDDEAGDDVPPWAQLLNQLAGLPAVQSFLDRLGGRPMPVQPSRQVAHDRASLPATDDPQQQLLREVARELGAMYQAGKPAAIAAGRMQVEHAELAQAVRDTAEPDHIPQLVAGLAQGDPRLAVELAGVWLELVLRWVMGDTNPDALRLAQLPVAELASELADQGDEDDQADVEAPEAAPAADAPKTTP